MRRGSSERSPWSDLFPGAFAARGVDRLDQRLDAQARAEVERLQPAACERVEKARDLDRLQVVEAELVAGRDAEEAVGRMVGTGLDAAKTLAAAPVRGRKKLQLVKRKFEPYTGYWCLPGGFIENCEHPADSAAREVLEETGLTIDNLKLLDAVAPGRNINVVILFYEASGATGEMVAGDDASDVRSFKHDDLPTNVAFELHRRAISNWFQEHQGKKAVINL